MPWKVRSYSRAISRWSRVEDFVDGPAVAPEVDDERMANPRRDAFMGQELHHVEQIARVLPVHRSDQLAAVDILERHHGDLKIGHQGIAGAGRPFISYSRKDEAFVAHLLEQLHARGRDAWVDQEKILPSEEWMQSILAAIDAAAAVIFVLSPDAITSEVCAREIDYAVSHSKRLIPIVCRPTGPDRSRSASAKLPSVASGGRPQPDSHE